MIEIQHVSYRYPGNQKDTLNEIQVVFLPGQTTAVMGANGSGKTTLIRCINGLLQPSSGQVLVDGLNTRDIEDLYEIRRKVGMVFQNPDNQIVATTVEREIAFGLENLGLCVDEMHQRVDRVLQDFCLNSYRHAAPHLLSGGERQRLALASVCAMEPDYLILDEPTSLLDPKNRDAVFGYIKQYQDSGLGVIMITQSAEEALMCDRLIVLHLGRIVKDDIPENVFSNISEIRSFGIQIPVLFELEAMIRETGYAD